MVGFKAVKLPGELSFMNLLGLGAGVAVYFVLIVMFPALMRLIRGGPSVP